MKWFFDSVHELHTRHERLKNFVHNGMRYPLPPWGQKVMGVVYMSIPIIAGYHIMQWAISKAPTELPEEFMKEQGQKEGVYGNTRIGADGSEQKVGAGGWGAGVNLAVSDKETNERSAESLKRYMRKLKREKRRKEREEQLKQQQQHKEEEEKAASKETNSA
mmetsp:Transcript_24106/g.66818  ORF Transcript_24106/g.66818 Transcript_24106/m.66818 type:complete len:162 (-) Transcript_24106:454-939(-)